MFSSVYISDINCITPLGNSLEENWDALLHGDSGVRRQDIGGLSSAWIGKIHTNNFQLPGLTNLESLLIRVAEPLLRGKQLTSRTGFVLSSTKGNIDFLAEGKVEEAELHRLGDKVASALGFTTKPIVVSHACVSGLLAVIVAKRLIQMGTFDEVLVLAGDMVSEFVLSGFQAFQAMSDEPCRPFDKDRKGVNLGEATAAAWLTKKDTSAIAQIIGEGAINDANHISGPSRIGEGLYQSIRAASKEAQMDRPVDFIAAHGTATLYNDEMEAIAFDRSGLIQKPLHSLKGYFGHTLGASGLLELVIALQSLRQQVLIPTKGYADNGTSRNIEVIQNVQSASLKTVLKTASGFGGSNAAVICRKV